MDGFSGLVDRFGSYVSLAAAIGVFMLLQLYFAQRKELGRLRDLMFAHPGFPGMDLAESENRLDRAEQQLEGVYAERGEPVTGESPRLGDTEVRPGPLVTAATATAAGLSPASHVTTDRPALAQVTMERAALIPHPRWQRLRYQISQPRWLAAIAVVAALAAGAAIVSTENLLGGDDSDRAAPPIGGIEPSSVTVSVLNGTTANGLASKVASNIVENGFKIGPVGNVEGQHQQTVVMFRPGAEASARAVAKALGLRVLQPLSAQVQKLAGASDVVVIAGEDRARA